VRHLIILSNKINQLERCETPNYTSVKVFDVQVPLYSEQVVKFFENRFQNLSYPSHKTWHIGIMHQFFVAKSFIDL